MIWETLKEVALAELVGKIGSTVFVLFCAWQE
jgi:hypothetical protein